MKRSLLLALAVMASFTILNAQQTGTTRITVMDKNGNPTELPASQCAIKATDGFILTDSAGNTIKIERTAAAQGEPGEVSITLTGSGKELSGGMSGTVQVVKNPDGSFIIKEQGGPVEVGGMAPDFEVELVGGSKVRMSDLRGNCR